MKKLLIGALTVALGINTVQAGKFEDAAFNEADKFRGSNQKVLVLFHTDNSPNIVLTQVRNAMQVRDPNAIFYPYWVTKIHSAKVVGKCGIIIGEWWSGSRADGASNWEPRVYNKVQNSVNLISFGYYYDDIESKIFSYSDAISAKMPDVISACES